MTASARRALLPLVPLYRLALAARHLRLGTSLEPVRRLRAPVISVGSLSAGGSGKTPLTVFLAKALAARDIRVDVLSRGYKRRSNLPLRVDPAGTAEDFGDEPLLIARQANVPVYVAAHRYDAGMLAEAAMENPQGPAVHLLDDGFQHRQLHRDVNILLLDSGDLSDHLLPAGNLREPLSAIRRAQIIAIPAASPALETWLKKQGWQGTIWRIERRMEVPRISGPVVAFCGIARSDQFFAGLEAAGLHLASRIAFPDHHHYKPHDIDCIVSAAQSINASAIITTEKDQVRLGELTAAFREPHPLMTAKLHIEIENEAESLDRLIKHLD